MEITEGRGIETGLLRFKLMLNEYNFNLKKYGKATVGWGRLTDAKIQFLKTEKNNFHLK